jgi:ABC-type glycerol-3-phosphate transport system permease component
MVVMGSSRRIGFAALTYATLGLFSAYCLFPFLWMVDTALKPTADIRSVHPTFLIAEPTLEHFRDVLLHSPFLIYFRNSLIVGIATTLLTLMVSIFCSYALSRWSRLGAVRAVSFALLLSQMIPGVLLLVPLYILMRRLGLLSSYWSLIIVYCAFTVPLCSFMLKGFFDAVPVEIEEAAEIDGCSRLAFLGRVLLPLCAPGLLATGVFAFIHAWNEFMFGYVLINNDAHRTLTPGIMLYKGDHITDWGSLMAASALAVIPVAISFVYLQRFLVQGLAAGAVKG